MKRLASIYQAIAAALTMALALLVMPAAQAQTIANTAQAHWNEAGQPRETTSNTVQFAVTPIPVTIETLRPVSGPATYPSLTAPQCGGRPLNLPGSGSGGGNPALASTHVLTVGETLYLRLNAAGRNTNPAQIDSIAVDITTDSGDRERVTIFETGPNTGIFVGGIPTVGLPPAAVQSDCRLSVAGGSVISVLYDSGSAQGTTRAAVDVLVDPYGLIF
ncbi:MAG: hypothetical protein J0M19_02645, partial [Sphingomonadales bacterium]|nr:hypothetical protein [Sphingomonadales bacterium]